MKVLAGTLLVAGMVVAVIAMGRQYYPRAQSVDITTAQVTPAPGNSRIDPNDITGVVPPLQRDPARTLRSSDETPAVNAIEPPSNTPAPEGAAPDAAPPSSSEPHFIDETDLDAPPEVLERRIENRVKSILDQISTPPARATDARSSR